MRAGEGSGQVARFAVRVQPGAKRNGVTGVLADGTIKLAVTAPPEGGRANATLVAWLAEALGVRERQVRVVRGLASRAKQVEVDGLDEAEIRERLGLGRADRRGER